MHEPSGWPMRQQQLHMLHACYLSCCKLWSDMMNVRYGDDASSNWIRNHWSCMHDGGRPRWALSCFVLLAALKMHFIGDASLQYHVMAAFLIFQSLGDSEWRLAWMQSTSLMNDGPVHDLWMKRLQIWSNGLVSMNRSMYFKYEHDRSIIDWLMIDRSINDLKDRWIINQSINHP